MSDQKIISTDCQRAESFLSRLQGLMGRSNLEEGASLLIEPCNSIHTFFMRFPIDVVYLNENYRILKITRAMKPWRVGLPVIGSRAVLEIAANGVADLSEGDVLCLS